MKRYFITGIGTNVGKTIVSAILTEALKADYWKPVQTGLSEGADKTAVASLVSNTETVFFKEAYAFEAPASPHIAADAEGRAIDMKNIQLPASKNGHLIIEGAGGLLVPLNNKEYVIDLARQFDAEIILVCRNYLGCINHSLLSINYLKQHGFKIKGIVLNGDFEPLVISAIMNDAGIPLLAQIAEIKNISKESIRECADQLNNNHDTPGKR